MAKNKGGRPKLLDGHDQIRNAKALFEMSVARGEPDFRYVALAIGAVPIRPPIWAIEACNPRTLFEASQAAKKPDYQYATLAIGSNPTDPPRWAVLACIEEKELAEKQAASGEAIKVGAVLDEVIRVLYEHEEASGRDGTRMPLAAAIREATRRTDFLPHGDGPIDGDKHKVILNAWKREQKQSASDSYLKLEGYLPTDRISRMMIEMIGLQENMSTNPMRDIWDHENPDDTDG